MQLHLTPTSGSWLNLVEVFVGIRRDTRAVLERIRKLVASISQKGSAKVAAALAVGAFLGIALVSWGPWSSDTRSDRFAFESKAAPGEFLYLDNVRVDSYLAQIRGGSPGAETQTEGRTKGLSISGGPTGSGSFTREAGTSRVVTRTAAADLLNLLDKLRDPDLQDPVSVEELDARADPVTFADGIEALDEGDFVIIKRARVLMPIHMRAYDAIRRRGAATFTGDPKVLRGIRRYASSVGPDPLFYVNLGAHRTTDGGAPLAGRLPDGRRRPGCPTTAWPAFGEDWPRQPESERNARVLVSVRYSLLLPAEASQLSGGDSTVVGKVIRVLREPEPRVKPRETDVCFRDEQARSTFALTGDGIPPTVAQALRSVTREKVAISLDVDTGVRAPAAVVLPIAIYR